MSDIPKGFGIVFDSAKVAPAKTVKARPIAHAERSKPTKKVGKESRKRDAPAVAEKIGDASTKRHRASSSSPSLIVSELGSPAAALIKDEDVKKWKAMSGEEENRAMIQASAQMLIASLRRAQKLEKEGARLKKAEAEISKLNKQMKDMEHKLKKTCDQHEATTRLSKKEAEDHFEINMQLNSTLGKLEAEISDLKARQEELIEDQQNGWKEEKARVESENFAKGFQFYAIGFIANDPNYDFTKFGEETAQWINEFKTKEAAAIKVRRVELGLEQAETADQGAPGDEEPVSTPPASIQEHISLQVDESGVVHSSQETDQGAPEDEAAKHLNFLIHSQYPLLLHLSL